MPHPSIMLARSLRIPAMLDDELRALAFATHTSKNTIMREALQLYLTIYKTTTHPNGEAVE
jgi:hypothetical protein